ncbi:MAG: polysaccharide biosynthesis protein [bacterium]|nr:polysaccharide biosynthesis protein [bacterium]
MKKETFIKSTIILMIGGFITKILGMFIKIVMSRLMGSEGIGLYMLVLPTFSLFIGLGQFGLPIALSKMVAEDKRNNKKLISSLLITSLIINVFLIVFLILFAPILANKLLQEERAYLPILAMAVVIPLTSTSSIVRSYFFGKQKMFPHVFSNCLEDIVRLALMFILIPLFLPKGLEITVTVVILSNVISELTSILVLFFFLPKNATYRLEEFHIKRSYIKDALDISIPTTLSRLIGSIGYFLEPIILTTALKYTGYSSDFILNQYGILQGYVLPLVLLPSFFTLAISQALLPVIAKAVSDKKITYTKNKIRQAIIFSLLIGIPATILFLIMPTFFLQIMYHTNQGSLYLQVLAPICLFQYIQAPLAFSLDAMGRSKDNLKATISGTIIRTITLLFFSLLRIGLWGYIISTSIHVIFVTIYNYYQVKKYLNNFTTISQK